MRNRPGFTKSRMYHTQPEFSSTEACFEANRASCCCSLAAVLAPSSAARGGKPEAPRCAMVGVLGAAAHCSGRGNPRMRRATRWDTVSVRKRMRQVPWGTSPRSGRGQGRTGTPASRPPRRALAKFEASSAPDSCCAISPAPWLAVEEGVDSCGKQLTRVPCS